MMPKKDNYYRLEYVNGDYNVVVEFSGETADEVFPYIGYFLRGCSWPDKVVKEYLKDD
jgi:hypothetical protein